jgi:hypothetical protein
MRRPVYRAAGLAVSLAALLMVPARASTTPLPSLPNPGGPLLGFVPTGTLSATATLTVQPGELVLTLSNVSAQAVPVNVSTSPVLIDTVSFTGLSYFLPMPGCPTYSASNPGCSVTAAVASEGLAVPQGVNVAAIETTDPGGTTAALCGSGGSSALPGVAGVGTGTWSLIFTCLAQPATSLDVCLSPDTCPGSMWEAGVVNEPATIADVQSQSFTLTGAAGEEVLANPPSVPVVGQL